MINEIVKNLTDFPNQAVRVFHGRGHNFSNHEQFNIEWYPPHLFVQNFSNKLDSEIEIQLKQLFKTHTQIESILIQNRTRPEPFTYVLCERSQIELPIVFWTKLNPKLNSQITLGKNQNTGIFLDMRAGWNWVKQHSKDKHVLNLFSYTSTFSLFALEGGANKVINMDMAANVLKTAQRNHQKSEPFLGKAAFYKRDILKSIKQFSKMGPYDLIIIDPPPYQGKSFKGWQDYEKLLNRCKTCLNKGGLLFVCLNTPNTSLQEFSTQLKNIFPDAKKIETIKTAPEIKEANPDKGLKTIAVYF